MAIDSTTGRQIWSGDQGEGGGTPAQMKAYAVANGIDPNRVVVGPDGVAWIPGVGIQNGNRAALGLAPIGTATSTAPGANQDTVQALLTQATKPAALNTGDAASIEALLRQNDLEELLPYVEDIARGRITMPQLLVQLYDPTSAAGKVVDLKYPEIRLRREAGRRAMPIAEIREYRDGRRQIFRQFNAPEGFYDQNSDATDDLVNDRSLAETKDLLTEWRAVADEAAANPNNVDTLDELHRLYGISPDSGEFLAYVIDKQRAAPILRSMVSAGRLSATATTAGFGGLDQTEAEQLAAGQVDPNAAAGTFSTLASSSELFSSLPGEQGSTVSRQEQLDAAFRKDSTALDKIEQQRANRTGSFKGGGRVAAGRDGLGFTQK